MVIQNHNLGWKSHMDSLHNVNCISEGICARGAMLLNTELSFPIEPVTTRDKSRGVPFIQNLSFLPNVRQLLNRLSFYINNI
jgi:hypothetical protein